MKNYLHKQNMNDQSNEEESRRLESKTILYVQRQQQFVTSTCLQTCKIELYQNR